MAIFPQLMLTLVVAASLAVVAFAEATAIHAGDGLPGEEEKIRDLVAVAALHEMKPARPLFSFAVDAGAILGKARKIGLAFQIADDILDHSATEEFARQQVLKMPKARER